MERPSQSCHISSAPQLIAKYCCSIFQKDFKYFKSKRTRPLRRVTFHSASTIAKRGCTFLLEIIGKKRLICLGTNNQLRGVTFDLLRLNWLQNSQSHDKKKDTSQASDCFQCSQWSGTIGQTFQIVQYQFHSVGFTTRPSHKIRIVPGELASPAIFTSQEGHNKLLLLAATLCRGKRRRWRLIIWVEFLGIETFSWHFLVIAVFFVTYSVRTGFDGGGDA